MSTTARTAEHSAARPPAPVNEQVRDYAPGSPERASLAAALQRMSAERIELPLFAGGEEIRTGKLQTVVMPHDHVHVLGNAHLADAAYVQKAIAAAQQAAPDWSRWHWSDRAAIFLKAADLLAGPWRDTLNAATMLGQSKTVHQAEIDSAVELIDFWRFNVEFMLRIYEEQPNCAPGTWNRLDYRPLEGFVFAITPFNFTAIAGNLPSAPALMGNTVVWKPATTALYSAHFVMQLLRAAGLPDGVINLVQGDGAQTADVVLDDPALAGVHFTGSTAVFNGILQATAAHVGRYGNYPRIVGETGGKNFVLAHPSADVAELTAAIIRGGFEYQGQKCSAASRIFVPTSLWPALRERLSDEIATLRVGDVADFRNFMGAVIDEKAWRKHTAAIASARADTRCRVLTGGHTSVERGYFVDPTLILADDGDAIAQASLGLRNAAGNFYINDKPTGAVVGQQPFGGARASGTNDKAGSIWNLIRWVSPRAIKGTLNPPRDYRYPFLG